ncbi:MAG: enoyl-CoA hydratase/isomerase family protein [Allorhizobium sp.]
MEIIATTTSEAQADVLVGQTGSLGTISLNRPKVLNSLTVEMVRAIEAALDTFEHDPHIASVLVTGEGERGFCAGGDIRALYDGGRAGNDVPETFWREEYRLNARIARYPKPYVAVMDGITMGGGVGLSAHGSHRIVTERTRIAMPETGIGFFPDIGATWLLSRGSDELGTYLALTGEAVGASEAMLAGLADVFVPHENVAELVPALSSLLPGSSNEQVSGAIRRLEQPAPESPFFAMLPVIDRCFASDSVAEILLALEEVCGNFAEAARGLISTRSPTSLTVTLRLLRLGRAAANLEECLAREFDATAAVIASHDFYEGIRAAIIDKDRNPQWLPHHLSDVTEDSIARYLNPRAQPLFD